MDLNSVARNCNSILIENNLESTQRNNEPLVDRNQNNDCVYLFQTFKECFLFCSESNRSKCLIENCAAFLKGKDTSNQKRHIRSKHPDVYKQIDEILNKNRSEKCANKNKLKVAVDQETVIKSCIEKIAIDGRPFKALNDKSFRRIIDPIIRRSW